tara:strand:+ start:99846 stop:100454 length:609 start_codon:yes stop_codon:yes gene_type:complete
MAKDTKENQDNETNDSSDGSEQTTKTSVDPNSKMKLIVIMALCMVLLSVTATVSTVLLTLNRDNNATEETANNSNSKEAAETQAEDSDEEDVYVNTGTPLFYQFNPTFVVNIPAKGRAKFLQVQVQIMTYDQKVVENIEHYSPLIKNDLVQLFGQQNYDELIKPNGKEMLRAKALKVVKSVITKNTGEDGVEQVLFTSFITQ